MMSKTEISALGEFALIDRLTQNIKHYHPTTVMGIGDDAAVIQPTASLQTLVTTDMLLEGIHFDLTYCPLKHLGYKACVVNFSDIYAMMGTPKQITLSIGVSKRFAVEDLEELYEGVRLACEHYHVDLVGGDTCASMTGLTLSITCIGEAAAEKITYRNGAKPTDLICVTGNLGAAYMGLRLLEREKKVFQGETGGFTPAFEGYEYLLERQLKPEARKDVAAALHQADMKPTAMMDISDGLSSELLHIARKSGVGIRIYENRLPIDYQTTSLAEQMNLHPITAALNGGEDYELLFTLPLALHDQISDLEDVHLIGHVTDAHLGVAMITADGSEIELQAQGWNAFKE